MPARLALTDAAATPRVGASPAPHRRRPRPRRRIRAPTRRAMPTRDATPRVVDGASVASDLGRPVDGSRLDESLTLRASSHHPRARSRRGDRARRRIETRDLDVVSQSKRAVGLR
jgi:hypothetical protein